MRARPILGVLLLGLLALVVFSGIVISFAPGESQVWDWFIEATATIIGTILAIAVGIGVFNYQSRKSDETREEQLLTTLAGEIQANQNILSKQRSAFKTSDGTIEYVILVRLSFLVAEEALRSGVFTSDEARLLSELITTLQTHNDELYAILSTRTGLENTGVIQGGATSYNITELKLRQKEICKQSAELLRELEKAGIKVPIAPNQENSSS